ncbi:hypothetical protein AB0H60_02235 [Nocardia rhamnosiphila]|nr:hypothetical protein [Nocardia zapadnayensis]
MGLRGAESLDRFVDVLDRGTVDADTALTTVPLTRRNAASHGWN